MQWRCGVMHIKQFSHLGDSAAYPNHRFHLQQQQATCHPNSSHPCTHPCHPCHMWWARRLFPAAAGRLTPDRSALHHRGGGGRGGIDCLLCGHRASSKESIKPEFQPSRWRKCEPLKNSLSTWYGHIMKLAPCFVCYIPKLKPWGSHRVGWEGSMYNCSPSLPLPPPPPHMNLLSCIQVQLYPPHWPLHFDFWDFNIGVCHVMKITVADSNPDKGLFNTTNVLF